MEQLTAINRSTSLKFQLRSGDKYILSYRKDECITTNIII